MTDLKNTKIEQLLITNDIDLEDINEVTVLDLYCFVDTDLDELIDVLSEFADALGCKESKLPKVKPDPHYFIDVYSDYYNETTVQADMAIQKQNCSSAGDMTIEKLFSIPGICSSNMSEFISILINKLRSY